MHNNTCIITCGIAQIKNGKFNNYALLKQTIVHYMVDLNYVKITSHNLFNLILRPTQDNCFKYPNPQSSITDSKL